MVAEVGASFVVAFSALFVVVEPFGVAPFFASMTTGRPQAQVRAIAWRACVVGAAILAGFTLFGGWLLQVLHVQLDAFRAAGGLLLLLTALDMLRGKRQSCRCSPEEVADATQRQDIAIVPLAVPLLAGPGSMATVMVLASSGGPAQTAVVLAAIAATFAASYLVLRAAGTLQRWAGPSVLAVVERVLGLLLAAIALQFLAMGAMGLLHALS
jgi:multiple antibiotic resistance protein